MDENVIDISTRVKGGRTTKTPNVKMTKAERIQFEWTEARNEMYGMIKEILGSFKHAEIYGDVPLREIKGDNKKGKLFRGWEIGCSDNFNIYLGDNGKIWWAPDIIYPDFIEVRVKEIKFDKPRVLTPNTVLDMLTIFAVSY